MDDHPVMGVHHPVMGVHLWCPGLRGCRRHHFYCWFLVLVVRLRRWQGRLRLCSCVLLMLNAGRV